MKKLNLFSSRFHCQTEFHFISFHPCIPIRGFIRPYVRPSFCMSFRLCVRPHVHRIRFGQNRQKAPKIVIKHQSITDASICPPGLVQSQLVTFLIFATTHLFKRSCPSVRPSLRRSDGPVLFSNDENRIFEVGKTLNDQLQ